jgi:serine/threonine protein kinase
MEPRRRFRIVKELAEGAFGKVYLAEMITGDNFKSVVAIKLLHGKWVGHEEIVQRSRDEARILGLLHHRNIVRVEDLTSINGQCAIIMEYLEGVDLKSLIRYCKDNSAALPRKVAFEIIASASTALDAAYHRKTLNSGQPLKLIHRDIKPSNVMVTVAGEVKVLDFGTAQAQFEHREAETQALAFGSAAYMAPERMMGDPDGPAGDIFSLGVTLFELLSTEGFGKIYIRGEKFDAALNERIDSIDLSDLGQARETQVRQVLRLMLAYEPEERPTAQQVVELMEALSEEVQDGSLRRFCREVVSPAHALHEPKGSIGESFSGSTLFEDSSQVREEALEEVEARVVSEVDGVDGDGVLTGSPDPLETGSEYIADMQHTDIASEGFAPPPDNATGRQAPEVSAQQEPPGAAGRSPVPRRSGGILLVGLALVGLALGGGILYGGYTLIAGGAKPMPLVVDTALKYSAGGRFETDQAGGSGGSLVLNMSGEGVSKVTISAVLSGYNFRWDGTGTLELVDLDPGLYRARIRTAETTIGLAAKVESGRSCAYRYNLDAGGEEWDDAGC